MVYFEKSKGRRIEGLLNVPSHPHDSAVILCHGFASGKDVGIIKELSEELPKWNFAALSFDFSGHGKSESRFEETTYEDYVEDLIAAKRFMSTMGFNKAVLLGHSMGAVIVIAASLKMKDVSALCLLAPGIGVKESIMGNENIYSASENGSAIFKDRWGKEWKVTSNFLAERERFDVRKWPLGIASPVLMVLAGRDSIIDEPAANDFFEDVAGKKKKVIFDGENHFFSGEDCAARISSEIEKFL